MKYYSLNRQSPLVDFREATINGQAPDKGLYFPERIPVLAPSFFREIEQKSDHEIAFEVIRPYTQGSIPEDELYRIVTETLSFPIPLVRLTETIATLELFHGPTLAFKDVGARFMSRCLGYFSKDNAEKITVLVATSGDTGGAVANGFYGVEGVEVVILYPSGKVSAVQEKQLTTLGKNVQAIKIDGSFDDCQKLVKQAFVDKELQEKLFLTSANSINVARWLPQQFYYFLAYKQWQQKDKPPVISVPSGNFGNICAGLLAHLSGLPVHHFIAACNANRVVPDFLRTGEYKAKQAIATVSNAMDVGDPSNFVRILELFDHQYLRIKDILTSYSISDGETKSIIRRFFDSYGYLLDPHGAVGLLALQQYQQEFPGTAGFFLETAHPVKFYDIVEPLLPTKLTIDPAIKAILDKPGMSIPMDRNFTSLKEFLLNKQ